jgi:glutaredoxin 3
MTPPVRMYTTPLCGYCVMAKRLLASRSIPFEEIDVAGNTEMREWLIEATGFRTVPQIFIHGRSIGGFTDLNALDKQGVLMKMIADGPQGSGA